VLLCRENVFSAIVFGSFASVPQLCVQSADADNKGIGPTSTQLSIARVIHAAWEAVEALQTLGRVRPSGE
jgi:hypothetical protein